MSSSVCNTISPLSETFIRFGSLNSSSCFDINTTSVIVYVLTIRDLALAWTTAVCYPKSIDANNYLNHVGCS
jgi:hypothetical protein